MVFWEVRKRMGFYHNHLRPRIFLLGYVHLGHYTGSDYCSHN